jgi:hypothetical protein
VRATAPRPVASQVPVAPARTIDRFEAERRRHALGDEVVPGG